MSVVGTENNFVLANEAGMLIGTDVFAFTPADLGTALAYWFKADALGLANNAAVASFTDSSLFGRHAGNGGAGTRSPTYLTNQLNGYAAVSFDGATDGLQTPLIDFSAVNKLTVFTVFKQRAAQTGIIYELTNDFNGAASAYFLYHKPSFVVETGTHSISPTNGNSNVESVSTFTAYKLVRQEIDLTLSAENTKLYVNSVLEGTYLNNSNLSGGTLSNNALNIGARAAGTSVFGAHDLCETLAVIAPSAQNVLNVETYCNNKYALY